MINKKLKAKVEYLNTIESNISLITKDLKESEKNRIETKNKID